MIDDLGLSSVASAAVARRPEDVLEQVEDELMDEDS